MVASFAFLLLVGLGVELLIAEMRVHFFFAAVDFNFFAIHWPNTAGIDLLAGRRGCRGQCLFFLSFFGDPSEKFWEMIEGDVSGTIGAFRFDDCFAVLVILIV
jgi:hypothetical protein